MKYISMKIMKFMSEADVIKGQRGFSLVEVLISTALLGLIAVAIMFAVQTAISASNQVSVRTTAESLVTAQMETIKSGGYIVADSGIGTADYSSTIVELPAGFRFNTLDRSGLALHESSAQSSASCIYGIPWDTANNTVWPTGATPGDPGIQSVTLIVESNAALSSRGEWKEILRIADFKVNR